MTTTTPPAQASDEQAVLSKQIAAWRAEVARLNDMIAYASGVQASDEPMRAVVALAWKWHDEAVASGFAGSEPAQELFKLLGWPDRAATPRATADVERYQFIRDPSNTSSASLVAIYSREALDNAIDAAIAATKSGDPG